MFVHIGTLKKRMKRAAGTGKLHTGCISGGTYISDAVFCLWMRNECLPNNIKALLVEFTGETGWEENTGVLVKGKEIQREAPVNKVFDLSNYFYEKAEVIEVTRTVLKYRDAELFQEKYGENVYMVREELLDLIDTREIDYDSGEMIPDRCEKGRDGETYIWRNNTGCLVLMGTYIDSEDHEGDVLFKELRNVRLKERRCC